MEKPWTPAKRRKALVGGMICHWVPRARTGLGLQHLLEELHRAGINYRTKIKPLEELAFKITLFVLT